MLVSAEPIFVEASLWKAEPRVEGGKRYLYCEPSNESTDLEGERVLRSALIESKDYFLEKGNFDIDHLSLIGLSRGIANPRLYEIGRPEEVKVEDDRIFVKGFIYSGEGEIAKRANEFWATLTELNPPMPWFPSVGGHVRESGTIIPKGENRPVRAITKVFWNNIGFSREPVNPAVPSVSVMPIGAFAKSWVGTGSHAAKAIEAGYGTDHASLTGGGALRKESLHGASDRRLRAARLIRAVQGGEIAIPLTTDAMKAWLVKDGLPENECDIFLKQLFTAIRHGRHL